MVVLTVIDAKSPDRTRYTIAKDTFVNIRQVKMAIDQHTAIPYDRQLLLHEGTLLRDDNANLTHYNIGDLAVIEVYEKFLSQLIGIDVVWRGRSHVYELSSEETVMTVKKLFEEEEGVPIHQQKLMAFREVMEDNDKLDEFAIHWSDVNVFHLTEISRFDED